jgi:adenylate kinase
MKNQIFCFIGLPASGKGTQAMSFAEERGFSHISIGDLVRVELKNEDGDTDLKKTIKELYDAGKPVTDEIVFKLLENKLATITGGVVFDNFPFNKAQADFLFKYCESHDWEMPRVIYIKIDPESAIKRISSRRICPDCKSIFIGGENCEKCGAKLITRSDDNEETVRKRIANYMPNIEEVISIFKPKNLFFEIDGEPTIDEVKKQVSQIQ